jgi:plastocyanin
MTTPPAGATLTMTASGISVKLLTLSVGSQVTFVNNDSVAHTIFSNPHPEHTDCAALNQVGFLQAGEVRQSGNLNIAQTCGFHDEGSPFNELFQGSIVVQ